jgi:lysine/ornithine N-monooxygenase/predicted FMN-binding regulatory protein PaiB
MAPQDAIGHIYDVVGVGFGPSNLALAVRARELSPAPSCVFLERHESFEWHRGMLIEGERMQVSFLKDLASLRNLASPYTFLQYTRAKGRLEHFVNLGEFRPTRLEYADYLRWVAGHFADQVCYGVAVDAIDAVPGDTGEEVFRVAGRAVRSGEPVSVRARNVVVATGGRPHIPSFASGPLPNVVHSSQFLLHFPSLFPDTLAEHSFLVVGGGQSAGEIVAYLLTHYANSRVHLVLSGSAPRPTDNSPFVNERFYSTAVDEFFELGAEARTVLAAELRNANYGVIREDLIDRIYAADYLDVVKGKRRLAVYGSTRVGGLRPDEHGLVAEVRSLLDERSRDIKCHGVVLATGYERHLDKFLDPMQGRIVRSETGQAVIGRNYRVELSPDVQGGLYTQGLAESSFGIGDTVLSLLPFRSEEILADIDARGAGARTDTGSTAYPPPVYLEHDSGILYDAIDRFRFATMVSAVNPDAPSATHLPLVLDRHDGRLGTLRGHLDRSNPQVQELSDRDVLLIFHGPNAYMSPTVFESAQLPTWNSMAVHVRGRVRLIEDAQSIVPILCAIAEANDPDFRLQPDDPRIARLIEFVVGVEVKVESMVGRFKLSQDRDDVDRRHAAVALAERTEVGEREFIARAVGLDLGAPRYDKSYDKKNSNGQSRL